MTYLAASRFWLLLAVAALLAGYVFISLRRRRYAARFTQLSLLASVAPRRPTWYRRHIPAALMLLSMVGLVFALARPAQDKKVPKERATIMLAIDVSESMAATDVTPSRLAAAKTGALAFVNLLPPKLQLGLVAFSGTASVLVNPTTDRSQVQNAINNLQLGPGTAIGNGIEASLTAIANSAKTQTGDKAPPPARIVLISDGETTRGTPNETAVAEAVKAKVPVSTIAYGTETGTLLIQGQEVPVPVNTQALQSIASDTKGAYYRAATGDELKRVYQGLGSSIGYNVTHEEVGRWFTGLALLLALIGGGLSVVWTSRLP
ncbi:MAG TPA: VWA domain-containing protein [Frankiaceae bacterium]|jgi:Ca-activated chloride channel family protein|nr:VWA domain-containing protein [Frankiaceae bacterium]